MRDSFRFILDTVFCNRRRAVITVAIIAVGVSALVGIQTALDVMADRIVGSFNRMGTGLCSIRPKAGAPPLTRQQAAAFCQAWCEAATGGLEAAAWSEAGTAMRVRSGGAATDPVVDVYGCDPGYLSCNGVRLAQGRGLSVQDAEGRQPVVLLGDNVRRKLFGEGSGLGEWVSCPAGRFRVIGVLERQGAMFGTHLDNAMLIPLDGVPGECSVLFRIPSAGQAAAVSEAGRLMSSVRRLAPGADLDFEIVRADSSEAMLASLRQKLSMAALVIGLITMLGAAVGLMNSMLVSVKERTREIGVCRALGAGARAIERQFLLEAIVIGQAGCVAGVVLGLLLGNLVAVAMDGDFMVPWRWLAFSVLLSLAVSLASGLLPAHRAAALDPIAALHSL